MKRPPRITCLMCSTGPDAEKERLAIAKALDVVDFPIENAAFELALADARTAIDEGPDGPMIKTLCGIYELIEADPNFTPEKKAMFSDVASEAYRRILRSNRPVMLTSPIGHIGEIGANGVIRPTNPKEKEAYDDFLSSGHGINARDLFSSSDVEC